jgi:uncharacterized membrane-anchored protein
MVKHWRSILIGSSMLIWMMLFNLTVHQKENILTGGKLVFLEMSSSDTRSPMQGDFVELHYKTTAELKPDSLPTQGFCILSPVADGVYGHARFQNELDPINKSEIAVRYSRDRNGISLGSSTYYFEEGKSSRFKSAGIRIDDQGHSVVIGLFDEHKKPIK